MYIIKGVGEFDIRVWPNVIILLLIYPVKDRIKFSVVGIWFSFSLISSSVSDFSRDHQITLKISLQHSFGGAGEAQAVCLDWCRVLCRASAIKGVMYLPC
jgi:hypothetical protein